MRVARLAAPPGPHPVGFAKHDQIRPVGQGPDRPERDRFRAVLDPPGQMRVAVRRVRLKQAPRGPLDRQVPGLGELRPSRHSKPGLRFRPGSPNAVASTVA